MDKKNCYVCSGTNHLFAKEFFFFFQSYLKVMTYPCTLLTLNNGHIMKILKSCEEKIKGSTHQDLAVYRSIFICLVIYLP